MLGKRDPELYGSQSYETAMEDVKEYGKSLGLDINTYQSNHEGTLVDLLHDADTNADAVVLNAGALTHYSYSIYDAIRSISTPVIETHLTDPAKREETFRHTSVINDACHCTFKGDGIKSYRLALDHIVKEWKP